MSQKIRLLNICITLLELIQYTALGLILVMDNLISIIILVLLAIGSEIGIFYITSYAISKKLEIGYFSWNSKAYSISRQGSYSY